MIRLLVALLGGAAAWSLHLVVSYLVVGLACRPTEPLLDPDGSLVVGLLVAISILAALGAVGAALLAGLLWRRSADGDGAHRGLAVVGLMLNLVFLTTIVIGATAIFVVPLC